MLPSNGAFFSDASILLRYACGAARRPVRAQVQIPCPNCRTQVYSIKQKHWASAFLPLKCAHCGAMAGPSWWSALALTPAPFIPVFGLWLSLTYKSWWPVSVAVSATIALHFAVTRYVPLGRISRIEVVAFRIGGAWLAAFLLGSAILALAG